MLSTRLWLFALFLGGVTSLWARPFSLVVYNVENLFDADGVAVYNDYQPARYTPAHLATKLENIVEIMARFGDGAGPDVILFQEIEVDQTPSASPPSYEEVVRQLAGRTVREWLEDPKLDSKWLDLSATSWLYKAMADRGLTGYHVAVGADHPDRRHEDGNRRAIKCVTFSRFPIQRVANHALQDARDILETELDIDGHPLIVFNLHWKSGAGNANLELIRIQNAEVLRARLDEIFAKDRNADVVIGGDFNSHYNQSQRYRRTMPRTALNDVLGSQGNELALRGTQRDLYNLWFEVPPEQRGSDTFRGEWGTLMQIIVSRGLYDQRGVQYQDNSFGFLAITGLNADSAGVPIRWTFDGPAGAGFSDHLPIYANFRTVSTDRTDRWIELQRPSVTESDGAPRPVSYASVDRGKALRLTDVPAGADLRDGTWSGRLFYVEGASVPHQYPRVLFAGEEYEIYGTTRDIRAQLYRQRDRDNAFGFYGELGTFRGRWQFVVRDLAWLPTIDPAAVSPEDETAPTTP